MKTRAWGRHNIPAWITRSLRRDFIRLLEDHSGAEAARAIRAEQDEMSDAEKTRDADADHRAREHRRNHAVPIGEADGLQRLFPNQTFNLEDRPLVLRMTWDKDETPVPRLPIDDLLIDIKDNKDNKEAKSKDVVERSGEPRVARVALSAEFQDRPIGVLCFEARAWATMAFRAAEQTAEQEARIRDTHARIEKVRELLTSPEYLTPDLVFPFRPRYESGAQFPAALQEFAEASAIVERRKSDARRFEELMTRHQQRFPAIKSGRANPWEREVAAVLSDMLLGWTGDRRGPHSSGLEQLLAEVYVSAGGARGFSFDHGAREGWALYKRRTHFPTVARRRRS